MDKTIIHVDKVFIIDLKHEIVKLLIINIICNSTKNYNVSYTYDRLTSLFTQLPVSGACRYD